MVDILNVIKTKTVKWKKRNNNIVEQNIEAYNY